MYLTTPPSVDSARLRSHAVVTFAIISGVLTLSPVTTSSKTSSLKCLLTGVLSTSPHASTVLSFGLPLRRTMIPSSSGQAQTEGDRAIGRDAVGDGERQDELDEIQLAAAEQCVSLVDQIEDRSDYQGDDERPARHAI